MVERTMPNLALPNQEMYCYQPNWREVVIEPCRMATLRRSLTLCIALIPILLSLAVPVSAAEMQDVVYMKNGGVVRGMIVAQIPSESLTIITTDGNRLIFKMDDVQRIEKEPTRSARHDTGDIQTESWYMVWGLGISSVSYGEEIDQTIDFLEGLPGVDRTTLHFDMLGIYFPMVDGKTLFGGIINGFGDRIDYEGEYFEIDGASYSASIMHFPQGTLGKGPFFRADFGPSILSIDGSEVTSSSSDWGFGGLIGSGLAYPLTPGTRLALTISYAFRRIEGENVGAWSAVISGIF